MHSLHEISQWASHILATAHAVQSDRMYFQRHIRSFYGSGYTQSYYPPDRCVCPRLGVLDVRRYADALDLHEDGRLVVGSALKI